MAATDNLMKVANATLTSLDAPGKPIGAASLNLVSSTNWPTDTGVIFAMRKVDASLITTANPAGVVPNSYTEWAAQLSGVTLSNLTLVYGTDQDYSEGVGTQVFIPLSGTWANRLIAALLLEHKQTGAHKDVTADSLAVVGNAEVEGTNQDRGVNLETIRAELCRDHIASGCAITGTSGLGWALSSGVVYIGGKRLTVTGTTGNVTASKDTYFDLHDNGDGTATLVNTGGNIVNNNVASPALAANSVRLGIVVSDGSAIVAGGINQGELDKVLPIASSIPYVVADSLGNLINPRDHDKGTIGYRQILANFTTLTAASFVDVTGLSVTVKVPEGAKVRVTAFCRDFGSSQGAGNGVYFTIVEDGVTVGQAAYVTPVTTYTEIGICHAVRRPSAGTHTYKVQTEQDAAGQLTVRAGALNPAFILVELI